MSRVSLIAAMDEARLIGAGNALPWRLPADLRRFRRLTTGKPVVMGRRTFESIGRALPERDNHVVTRRDDLQVPGITVHASLDGALAATADAAETMVIGGAQIYAEALAHAERMYLTRIAARFDGDTWFPEWDPAEWKLLWCEHHDAGAAGEPAYRFEDLARVRR